MKSPKIAALSLLVILASFCSCQHEENLLPSEGKVSFSFANKKSNEGGRTNDDVDAAFVWLTIRNSKGQKQENIKVPIFSSGSDYITESIDLQFGDYELTQFVVLDVAGNVIYKTPMEGSDLAKYVLAPLPLKFTIAKRNTQVTVEVLGVSEENEDEAATRLNINLQYPDLTSFDSAFVTFKNADTKIKIKLTLNDAAYTATGHVSNLTSGSWDISISYFSGLSGLLREKQSVVNLLINPTATDLILIETSVFVKSVASVIDMKAFKWEEYFYYNLILNNKLEGFARFPKDPLNPHFEILTFEPKWIYVNHSRSFYNSSLNGASNYYQGGAAFELYGNQGENHDRLEQHIINTTSLTSGLLTVHDKVWNTVNSIIIMYDDEGNELFGFFRWN